MILLIDNYDSFSYNLYQLIGSLMKSPDIRVVRNDEVTTDEIAALSPGGIVLSPGPGYPAAAGVTEATVVRFAGKIPILGVCLGHQAICEAFGAKIIRAKKLMHGKQSDISLDTDCALFRGLPSNILGARYHSLAADRETLPESVKVTARSGDGEIMAASREESAVYGLQFHPESILTPLGDRILINFLRVCRAA